MKHIIIGGDGFVGRHLAQMLLAEGETVVVADRRKTAPAIYPAAAHVEIDVTDRESLERVPLGPDDVVYNCAARMLSPILPRAERRDFFWPVNHGGVANILSWMEARGANRLVQFTTDMVYGHTRANPRDESHPREPLGEYGASKLGAEALCEEARARGFRISIFRPRLIIGPGRLGILGKLFALVDRSLPVPMIGSGRNAYQFISVYDCASAAMAAWKAGFPNSAYNLGSDDPPSVRDLLGGLIEAAGSRSILVPTPAALVKLTLSTLDAVNLPLMDPEQFLIADEFCILDTSRARRELHWTPQYRDQDMLVAAYREYRAGLAAASPASELAKAPS